MGRATGGPGTARPELAVGATAGLGTARPAPTAGAGAGFGVGAAATAAAMGFIAAAGFAWPGKGCVLGLGLEAVGFYKE